MPPVSTGDHSKQDKNIVGKNREIYIGFCVYRRPYLLPGMVHRSGRLIGIGGRVALLAFLKKSFGVAYYYGGP